MWKTTLFRAAFFCRDGMHEFIDRQRGRKGGGGSHRRFLVWLVWHFSPNLSTQSALWEQHGGKCKHFVPVMGRAFVCRRYTYCTWIRISKQVPIDPRLAAAVLGLLIGCSSQHVVKPTKCNFLDEDSWRLSLIPRLSNTEAFGRRWPANLRGGRSDWQARWYLSLCQLLQV